MPLSIILKVKMRAWVLALLLAGSFAKAQGQTGCNQEFFREDFDPPTNACSFPNNPSCYARAAFTNGMTSQAQGTNPTFFSDGEFRMLTCYPSGNNNCGSPTSKAYCAAGYVGGGQSVSLWSKPANIPLGKATVTLAFTITNNSQSAYLNIHYGFSGRSIDASERLEMHAQERRMSITLNTSDLYSSPTVYIYMTEDAGGVNHTGSVAIDDIVLSAAAAGPGDATRAVCGFGMRNVAGPGSGVYNWYDANGTRVPNPTSPSNSISANITDMRTVLRVAEVDLGTGCESAQSTVVVNVQGVGVFTDDFNDTNDYTGYPQGWLNSNFDIDTTKMNFSTRYKPTIVRYINNQYNNNTNCRRTQNNGYPCHPGSMDTGGVTIAYDPYSYNSAWLMWPDNVTLPLNPVSPNPPFNRFLIADSKYIANSAGKLHKLWSRKVPIRAGFNYEVRLKMMNALPSGNAALPTALKIFLGNGPSVMSAQLSNSQNGYSALNDATTTIPQDAQWHPLYYLVTAPATIPADGKLRLSLFTVNADNSINTGGQDFLLDDIELIEIGSATGPLVSNATLCDPGSVTLSAPAPGDYHWFSDAGLTQPIGTGNSVSVTATNRGPNYFYVQDLSRVGCPSVVKQVEVRVYNTLAAFAVTPQPGGTIPIAAGFEVIFAATPGAAGSTPSYTWNWGDGSASETVSTASTVHAFAQPGNYQVKLTVTEHFRESGFPVQDCPRESTVTTINVFNPLCALVVPTGGQFKKDNRTGADTYKFDSPLDCIPSSAFECIGEAGTSTSNVVAFSATAFADTLVRADLNYSAAATNPFLNGRNRLRPYGTYTYQAPISSGLDYAAGTFTMNAFDWQSSARARPSVWIPSPRTTRLSPDGQVLQEQDALNVKSTAKFGYGRPTSTGAATAFSAHALPYLKAQNAEYTTVLFESFETVWDACSGTRYGEDGLALLTSEVAIENTATTGKAHTGAKAVRLILSNNQGQLTLKDLPITAQLRQAGLNMKVWVQTEGLTLNATTTKVWVSSTTSPSVSIGDAQLKVLAQTGEWTLYEAILPLNTTGISTGLTVIPHLQFSGTATTGTAVVRLDDVRMQPQDAQMTSYVYDPKSLRLVAVFDDQHFPLLYQYNAEGKLIRKQVETERGVKTIQETLYHTPQIDW